MEIFKKWSCVLLDDEAKALTSLRYELAAHAPQIEIVAEFTQPERAKTFLQNNEIDLLFLDIQLGGIDAFSWLDSLDLKCKIVFTTAHSSYALDAIHYEAFGYLVKPIDAEELAAVLLRLHRHLSPAPLVPSPTLNHQEKPTRKIKLHLDKKIVLVAAEDILYCASDGNYCQVVLTNKTSWLLTQKLKQFSASLPESAFFRVHNCYTIQLDRVTAFYKNEGYLVLDEYKKIPVSRQKRNELLERL